MPKKITIRNFNGTVVSILNAPGGNMYMPKIAPIICTNVIPITEEDLGNIYNDFVKPFVNDSPFHMAGSIELLTTIYSHILVLIDVATTPKTKLLLEIFRDILTILLQARDVYFDNVRLNNEVTTLRNKYQLNMQTILDLTAKLAICQEDEHHNKNTVFSGDLGIVINQPKNLIYAQAILNLDIAWYYYLHNTKKIEPRLFASTMHYVTTLGTTEQAYDKLIILLDDKYKTD